jgi:hypothetical protein
MGRENDPGGRAYRTSFDPAGDRSLSTVVAFAIAESRGVDPSDLAPDTTLADLIDTEVLDDLADGKRPAPEKWTFEFSLGPEMVEISSDGTLTIRND